MFEYFDAYYAGIAAEIEATRIRPEWDERPELHIAVPASFKLAIAAALLALVSLAVAGFTL